MKVLVALISLMSIVMSQNLAITGGPSHDLLSGSCAVTQYSPTRYRAWWMLMFPVDTVYITNVKIYFRSDDRHRLAGYSLYVSNSSTSKTDGYLCYHDKGPELPPVYQDVICNNLGQFVILYNERDEGGNDPAGYSTEAIMELCHVEVNECSHGYYGYNCNESCDGCLLDSCERENGVCTDTSGCKPRRQLGQLMKCECASEKFGNNCSRNCHCVNQPCDFEHGRCPAGGCERGNKGSTCSTECILGHYGYNCEESCDGCLLDSCERENGVCTDTNGCKPGRKPGQLMKCDIACGSGTFGNSCSGNCHCINQPCHPGHGTFPAGGCQSGYKGKCASGDCGYDCEHHCRICVNSSCDKYEGMCTHGCNKGFEGLQCQSSVTPQSDGQTTKENTMNIIYAVIGTFIVITLVYTIILLAILRYRKQKRDGTTTKQGGQRSRVFNNGAFTNDYANTVARNRETHYEDTIMSGQEQVETYDTI